MSEQKLHEVIKTVSQVLNQGEKPDPILLETYEALRKQLRGYVDEKQDHNAAHSLVEADRLLWQRLMGLHSAPALDSQGISVSRKIRTLEIPSSVTTELQIRTLGNLRSLQNQSDQVNNVLDAVAGLIQFVSAVNNHPASLESLQYETLRELCERYGDRLLWLKHDDNENNRQDWKSIGIEIGRQLHGYTDLFFKAEVPTKNKVARREELSVFRKLQVGIRVRCQGGDVKGTVMEKEDENFLVKWDDKQSKRYNLKQFPYYNFEIIEGEFDETAKKTNEQLERMMTIAIAIISKEYWEEINNFLRIPKNRKRFVEKMRKNLNLEHISKLEITSKEAIEVAVRTVVGKYYLSIH